MVTSRIALSVACSVALGWTSISVAAIPFVEDFTSDRNANWTVYAYDSDDLVNTGGLAFNPGPGNSGYTPYATADANNGHFITPIPTFSGDTTVAGDYGGGLLGVALNKETQTDGGFWPTAAGTAAIYNGGLLGNLGNTSSAVKISYRVNISGTYQPVDNTGAPVGSLVTVNPGDALTNGMFYAGSYGHPAGGGVGDPGQYTYNPEEVRVSLYFRRYDPDAVGDTGSNESSRFFNEGQDDRGLFAYATNAGLQNGVTFDLEVPLDPASLVWQNYFGYGNAGGPTWTGPSGTALSNFTRTMQDVQQLRFQIDSSYYGANGTALAPGLTGSLEILSISLIPEPTSLGLLGLAGLGLARRRRV